MSLPRERRQTGEQAAAFALEATETHDFPCSGDRRRKIMAWLTPRIANHSPNNYIRNSGFNAEAFVSQRGLVGHGNSSPLLCRAYGGEPPLHLEFLRPCHHILQDKKTACAGRQDARRMESDLCGVGHEDPLVTHDCAFRAVRCRYSDGSSGGWRVCKARSCLVGHRRRRRLLLGRQRHRAPDLGPPKEIAVQRMRIRQPDRPCQAMEGSVLPMG